MLKAKLGDDDYKYPKMSDFIRVKVYADKFVGASNKEKERLRQSANWMHIFFKMVSTNRNKELSIQVISKLLEGWNGIAFATKNINININILFMLILLQSNTLRVGAVSLKLNTE